MALPGVPCRKNVSGIFKLVVVRQRGEKRGDAVHKTCTHTAVRQEREGVSVAVAEEVGGGVVMERGGGGGWSVVREDGGGGEKKKKR